MSHCVPKVVDNRAAAIVFVASLHVLVLWMLASGFAVRGIKPVPELNVTVFNSRSPVAQAEPPRVRPDFRAPEVVIVPEPDVIIDDSDQSAMVATPLLQRIPPQPDAGKPHDLPTLPDQYRAWARTASLVLRLLIFQDGSVGETTVVRSSGHSDIDDFVCSFVRANWHYLPATVSGVPVKDSMTVVVRFAT